MINAVADASAIKLSFGQPCGKKILQRLDGREYTHTQAQEIAANDVENQAGIENGTGIPDNLACMCNETRDLINSVSRESGETSE